MTIGQAQVVSNGQTKAIDVAPVLQSSRTFLPARFVAEGLGYQVDWDEANQIVVCWPAGQPKPDVSGAVDYLTRLWYYDANGKLLYVTVPILPNALISEDNLKAVSLDLGVPPGQKAEPGTQYTARVSRFTASKCDWVNSCWYRHWNSTKTSRTQLTGYHVRLQSPIVPVTKKGCRKPRQQFARLKVENG